MIIVEGFLDIGFIIIGLSFGVFLGSFVKHFIDLRNLIYRLFDEYKQDELSENLTKLDKSLMRSAYRIFFSGFFFIIGLLIIFLELVNN
ncbi:MAG: hypothetical protein EAX86_06700 [Candidatus Heimdallarchaeota archaeon]|nr:hypothetical protein [Candidatus Heimdallarchaeota archaeon]